MRRRTRSWRDLPFVSSCAALMLGLTGIARTAILAEQASASISQPQAIFRTATDLVKLDVSVLDANRSPVRGLKAADFVILEDGVAKPVEVFSAVESPPALKASASWTTTVTPDVTTNTSPAERLFVMILDDGTLGGDVGALKAVSRIARDVINHIGPSDQLAIVFTRDNRFAQDFTGDHARLNAAVDHYTLGFAGMGHLPPSFTDDLGGAGRSTAHSFSKPVDAETYFKQSSVDVLTSVAESLATVSDRRKAIFYVSVGVSIDLSKSSSILTIDTSMADAVANSALTSGRDSTIRKALIANVPVYAIDPCGLRTADNNCGGNASFLEEVSKSTGGRALVNTNEFETGVEAVFEENSAYYLLGYRAAAPARRGEFHRLVVKVDHPGWTVRSRHGYSSDELTKPSAKPGVGDATFALLQALQGMVPATDLPLQVNLAPFWRPGAKEARVAIALGVRQPLASAPMRSQSSEIIELETRAFTPEGDIRGVSAQHADVRIRPGSSGEFQLDILSFIDLKPGRYQIRLATFSDSLRKSGSVYADVIVPDFAEERLSLSGVVLTANPAPYAAGKDALELLIPVVPTSAREFLKTTKVGAFFCVYQGGKTALAPVMVQMQIKDEADHEVWNDARNIGIDQFGRARQANVQIQLPVSTLFPGGHVLLITAGTGSSLVRGGVRFAIR